MPDFPVDTWHDRARRRMAAAAGNYVVDASQDRTLPNKIVIAVVDDDQSVREALAGLIKSLGYRPAAFDSADAFLNWDRRQSAACLVADVQMPGMSGPELHERLIASGCPIPTILITAYPDEATRTRTLQAGVKCYLTKPFRGNELLECIRSVIAPDAAGASDV